MFVNYEKLEREIRDDATAQRGKYPDIEDAIWDSMTDARVALAKMMMTMVEREKWSDDFARWCGGVIGMSFGWCLQSNTHAEMHELVGDALGRAVTVACEAHSLCEERQKQTGAKTSSAITGGSTAVN